MGPYSEAMTNGEHAMKRSGKLVSSRKADEILAGVCLAIDHIAASRFVEGYAIGLTGNPLTRIQSYKREEKKKKNGGIDGFALLAWGMSKELALYVEEGVYLHVKGKPKSSTTFAKCNERISCGQYRPSVNRKFKEHYLYIIW